MNNFEQWKKDLKLEDIPALLNYSCIKCPLFEKCVSISFRMSKSCKDLLAEWGEKDGDTEED